MPYRIRAINTELVEFLILQIEIQEQIGEVIDIAMGKLDP